MSVNHRPFLGCFFVNWSNKLTRDTGFRRGKTWDFLVPLVCDTATAATAVVPPSAITNESRSW